MNDGRRGRFTKGGHQGNPRNIDGMLAGNNQFFQGSPMNKSKQDVFSQTGKLNTQGSDCKIDENNKMGSFKSQTLQFQTQLGMDFLNLFAKD
jgi:hypothetical protein